MFSVQQKYQSSIGEIRYSQALAGARLGSATKGIALKYVSKGTEHYEINQQQIPVHAGQLLILPQEQKFAAFTDNHKGKAHGISLSLLSRHVGISSYYFSRLFQACFQQSPQQLQVTLRMQTAVKMLQETNDSLSDIAYTLGYCDLASFSHQFKQYYEESPSQWRKTAQQHTR